jgi:2-methylisocitrate lyase-like PEP mutase family enzyme
LFEFVPELTPIMTRSSILSRRSKHTRQISGVSMVLILRLCIGSAAMSVVYNTNTNMVGGASGASDPLATACPPPQRLRQLLELHDDPSSSMPLLLPCCYDGLTARLVARSGLFHATFMTGFGVSAARGYSDTQLVSFAEMVDSARQVSEGLVGAALETKRHALPCIADGDTGYGNAVNVKRTVHGYARAGMAGIMIEDQVSPKRCGHVSGKATVPMPEAVQRVRAACDARDEYDSLFGLGTGPLILARTGALNERTRGNDTYFRDALYSSQS